MDILALKPRVFTPGVLSLLAKQGLIRPLVEPPNVMRCRNKNGAAGAIYTSRAQYGSHKVISVRCTTGPIRLNYHQDNEEFILIHPRARSFNPLYMIIGLHKCEAIRRKAKKARFARRILCAEIKIINHPVLSIFTMLKGTPHFEVAGRGRKEAPVFCNRAIALEIVLGPPCGIPFGASVKTAMKHILKKIFVLFLACVSVSATGYFSFKAYAGYQQSRKKEQSALLKEKRGVA